MPETLQLNADATRIELPSFDGKVYADIRREGTTLWVDYVFAAPELRGSGAAGKLMQAITEYAVQHGLKIVPICGYAASWLKRHGQS